MSSRRSVGSQIVFNNPRAISVRSGGSKTSGSTVNVTLARRLLFPYLPLTTPLPPLVGTYGTSEENEKRRNDPAFKALDTELYDFLALVVRGFVLPWWSKITPRDKEFPQEITKIVATFIKQVETRAMAADVPALLANAIPLLVSQHYRDFRLAQAKLPTSYATGLHGHSDSLPHIFHSLQPHMAVTAEGTVDPHYLRQVVEHIMKTCLPPEDWEAEAERSIVREIVLKILLESAFPRLSQPWFLQKTMLELLGPPEETVLVKFTPRSWQDAHCLAGSSSDQKRQQRLSDFCHSLSFGGTSRVRICHRRYRRPASHPAYRHGSERFCISQEDGVARQRRYDISSIGNACGDSEHEGTSCNDCHSLLVTTCSRSSCPICQPVYTQACCEGGRD